MADAEAGREVARSELRASHQDRDRVVEVLRVSAGDGRLTAEELDERLELAMTARTYGELAKLVHGRIDYLAARVEHAAKGAAGYLAGDQTLATAAVQHDVLVLAESIRLHRQ